MTTSAMALPVSESALAGATQLLVPSRLKPPPFMPTPDLSDITDWEKGAVTGDAMSG